MQVKLPISGSMAVLRDFIPHKVVVQANDALYKGVQIKSHSMTATKEELLAEFGVDEIAKMDKLKPAEYDKKLTELREEYLRRKVEMDGLTLGNVEEANIRKVTGIVVDIDGTPASRETIEDLPHEDFEVLLESYDQILSTTSTKKKSAQQES